MNNIFSKSKLVEILRTSYGTTFGLGFWSLLWIGTLLGTLNPRYYGGEWELPLIYYGFFAWLFQSSVSMLFAVIFVIKRKKIGLSLIFSAISPWIPFLILRLTDRPIHSYSDWVLFVFSSIISIIAIFFIAAYTEFLLIKWSNKTHPRRWYHWVGIVVAVILGLSTLIPTPNGKLGLLLYIYHLILPYHFPHCPFAPISTMLCWSIALLIYMFVNEK